MKTTFVDTKISGIKRIYLFDLTSYLYASASGVLVLAGAVSTTIGVAGTTEFGDGTLRVIRPQTTLKIDLGDSTHLFNDLWVSNIYPPSKYNNVAIGGLGFPTIYGLGRSTARTAAVASVAVYNNTASDASYLVTANVLVTTATTHDFTVTCAYTDEGNTARTLTFNFTNVGGTIATAITNAGGTVPYMSIPVQIRCKASTAITIATTGTFTTVTYNVEGFIMKLN